jgi:hypothetical protein
VQGGVHGADGHELEEGWGTEVRRGALWLTSRRGGECGCAVRGGWPLGTIARSLLLVCTGSSVSAWRAGAVAEPHIRCYLSLWVAGSLVSHESTIPSRFRGARRCRPRSHSRLQQLARSGRESDDGGDQHIGLQAWRIRCTSLLHADWPAHYREARIGFCLAMTTCEQHGRDDIESALCCVLSQLLLTLHHLWARNTRRVLPALIRYDRRRVHVRAAMHAPASSEWTLACLYSTLDIRLGLTQETSTAPHLH